MHELAGKRIWVAGERGMVGSATVRRLIQEDVTIIPGGRDMVDLRRQSEVERFLQSVRPDAIVIAAAKVGGILANDTLPADFLYDNLVIQTNIIHAAYECDVERLLFLGSSCIYPRDTEQPISESALLTGPLEPTNEWYAIAKIAGIKMVQAYRRQFGRRWISAMPTNLYGPGDNFDLSTSHVLPALLRKVHEAEVGDAATVTVWGSGMPRREFLHVDDCADALVFLLRHYDEDEHINVGSGEDISILELTRLVCRIVGFGGEIVHDRSKPDGMMRKLMSADKLRRLGWQPRIALEDGIEATYQWFLNHGPGVRG